MTEEPTFDDLGLDDSLVAVVRGLGYESPSPIQGQAIPALLRGGDVVGLAQTGTGKTAAFALPMVQRLDPAAQHVQALVLAPTRELALQVSEAITTYASGTRLKVLPVYGGQNYGTQLQGLKRGAQVVVGTPGRIIDHLDRGSLDLSQLEMLVLDEADEMLNMGFAEDVERILADTPEYKQVALFSATMPAGIRRLAKRYLHDPQDISTPEATRSTTNVRQRWMPVSHHNKLDALTRVLEVEQGDGMLIFVRTKSATEELAEKLRSRGYTVAALNGDLAQAQRERTVGQLKSGVVDIVVATDVAARGLDVDRITHVVNYDIPHDPEAYVHRIGRTGRAGRTGDAIVFITPRERGMLKSLERVSGRPVEQMAVPSPDEVNARRVDRFAGSITTALGDPQFQVYKTLVEQYTQENESDITDVAAALAVMSQDDKQFFLRPDPPQEKRPVREKREHVVRPTSDGMASYRIAVGKRHKIRPAMVVGALANEGGLKRSDFGKITIGIEHTIVELPADLPEAVFDQLAGTRISGKRIDLQPDQGRPGGERKYPAKSYSKPAGKSYSKPAGKSYSKPAGKTSTKPKDATAKDRKPRHKKDR